MLQSKEEWAHPYQEGLPNTIFQENRAKFVSTFRKVLGDQPTNAIGLFKGYYEIPIYNCDQVHDFR